MQKDWRDFKALYGNIEGARAAFEIACESLFRQMHPNENVKTVAVKQGDGGIDVFIGEYGIEPITVIQCKFFLEQFEDSQQAQIRESFKTAISSTEYELKNWILCVPRELPTDEAAWWSKWKSKMLKEYDKTNEFITLKNGNELIELMKVHDVYNTYFQIEDSQRIKDIHEEIFKRDKSYSGVDESLDDLTIIDDICDHVLETASKKMSSKSEIMASDSFAKIEIKVPLNFPEEQRNRIAEMLHNTWTKREVVRNYLRNLEDEIKVLDLKERIQQDYCEVRGIKDPQEPIQDVKFIDELSQKILPTQRRSNLHYQTNAKAIILYFFEFCDLGKKTETEIKNQLSFKF